MNEGWVVLRDYDNRIAADLDAQQLEAADIPAQIDDASIGLFGPGFAGSTAMGVRILVPHGRLEDARAVLGQ
jgi:hypothetical protein